ncbi:MAG: GAK system ATP-grasp enzyme [Mariprofundales bacterium]|nr:GAK system ATP-grasp enzyme [Mariprofundales bacterium]
MSNPRIGVIGIPNAWSTETLADRVEQATGFRLVVDMAEVELDLAQMTLRYDGWDLCQLDALLIKKISKSYAPDTLDRLELLRVAEQSGLRIFSPPINTLRLIDRLSCTITLRQHDIPMPESVITADYSCALQAVERFGDTILKPLYSTKARGMLLINSSDSHATKRAKLHSFHSNNPMLYIQRKLNLPGHDLGMVFLGGDYLGCYSRVKQGSSWNTTIHSGGRYQPYQPSTELIDLAYRAQKPFALDFTTVDVAETDQGAVVFEVSAFGGFRGAQEGIGIDAAALYVEYALAQLS